MTGRTNHRGAALVTGGARRIGRAISLRLATAGYAVAVHCNRSQDEARALRTEIERGGGRCAVVGGDLADVAAAAKIVDDAAASLGPLTLLVNNAAIFEPDEIGTIEPALWQRQMTINFATPVFLAQRFAAQAPAGSSIVNVLDQRVLKPVPRFLSYGLSKSALHAATHMLAQALAPAIRVNAVAPGPVLPSTRQSEAEFARQAAALPLGRGATADDVAGAVLYLAGAASVTGALIPLDGGQHLAWETPDLHGIRE